MSKWYDENGSHEQTLSDAELAKDLRDLKGVERLLREGKITLQKFEEALNILRPAENNEPALGDLVRERDKRMDYRGHILKKRGRKGFQELGE